MPLKAIICYCAHRRLGLTQIYCESILSGRQHWHIKVTIGVQCEHWPIVCPLAVEYVIQIYTTDIIRSQRIAKVELDSQNTMFLKIVDIPKILSS